MSGTLFVVGTPIGNLGDMTHRAVETLQNADLVLCEDTRRAGILLAHYGISKPKKSFHAQSSGAKLETILTLLAAGQRIAFVTDAGTPCVSDPGFSLVAACRQRHINVVPVPGPCAMVAGLSVAGIPSSPLVWWGFLPHKKGRQTLMKKMADMDDFTHAMYESVHRLMKLLVQLSEHMPQRHVVVARELTKRFEEVTSGTPAELIAHFEQGTVKGEFVVFVAPSTFKA